MIPSKSCTTLFRTAKQTILCGLGKSEGVNLGNHQLKDEHHGQWKIPKEPNVSSSRKQGFVQPRLGCHTEKFIHAPTKKRLVVRVRHQNLKGNTGVKHRTELRRYSFVNFWDTRCQMSNILEKYCRNVYSNFFLAKSCASALTLGVPLKSLEIMAFSLGTFKWQELEDISSDIARFFQMAAFSHPSCMFSDFTSLVLVWADLSHFGNLHLLLLPCDDFVHIDHVKLGFLPPQRSIDSLFFHCQDCRLIASELFASPILIGSSHTQSSDASMPLLLIINTWH